MIGFIYFIFYKNELIYIGQTVNIKRRISEHGSFEFDYVRFIKCERNRLFDYESRLIKFFRPKANRNNNPNYNGDDHPRMPLRRKKRNGRYFKRNLLIEGNKILIKKK